MSTKWKRALIMAACVSLGSQVSVALFVDGFIVAMAVVILGFLMYEYNLLQPAAAGILVGVASPMFRGLVLVMRSDLPDLSQRILHAWNWIYPEFAFYITYGICFTIFYRNNTRKRNLKNYFFCLMLCDFFSNVAEMLFRFQGSLAVSESLAGLALLAVCRSALVCCLLVGFEMYTSLLSKEEHEERYKKLMIMVSVFRSEIYFMNKNMVEIEDIMKKAFKMYKLMERDQYPAEMRNLSLDIAKDVHEIKKDYIRVIKGLQQNFLAEMDVGSMHIRDVISILELDIREQIEEKKLKVEFDTYVKGDFFVEDHFSLMSVLRNLVLNSLEAIGDQRRDGVISLRVTETAEKDVCVFTVSDNGGGIRESDLDTIFDAGFSTKFDDATGAISRGVGLTLVRDLVQDKFQGTVQVESKEGENTVFTIQIPRSRIEGGQV